MFVYGAAYALSKAPICRSSVVRSNISKRNAAQPHSISEEGEEFEACNDGD